MNDLSPGQFLEQLQELVSYADMRWKTGRLEEEEDSKRNKKPRNNDDDDLLYCYSHRLLIGVVEQKADDTFTWHLTAVNTAGVVACKGSAKYKQNAQNALVWAWQRWLVQAGCLDRVQKRRRQQRKEQA